MTVEELLDHFEFIPNEISYYDVSENVQDVVRFVMEEFDGDLEVDHDLYSDFVYEHGQKEVVTWSFDYGSVLKLEMRWYDE